MVGGISTLIRDKEEGELLPANDPWQIANAIIELSNDSERMKMYSLNSRQHALERHNPANIKNQLLNCYNELLAL